MMQTIRIRSFMVTAVFGVLLLAARASAGEAKKFHPRSTADYGSGASIRTDWYTPGGLGGGIGAFVGHPNGLARSDRALVRFDLSPLFLKPQAAISRQTAVLRFTVASLAGKTDRRKIEIVWLKYDPWNLTGNDLINTKSEVVGTVVVERKGVPGRVYSIDATKWVREDLLLGNKFCGFRFRDVEAEANGNPDIAAIGAVIAFNESMPVLEIKEIK